jgi:glycosyltransferase involved in cell wall biosynthesis
MTHQISIIIPTLNEAEQIANLINHLTNNSSEENISDIIIVDGGSLDGTQNIVSEFKNITLLNSPKGRAKQMNLGVKSATGNILYFLHADSFPPKNFDRFIINELQKGNQAGCFRMQFDSNHW